MKRENASSWNSGPEKEQILETYSAQLQKSWNFTKNYFGIYKKYWAKKAPEGTHQASTRVGARPTPWAHQGAQAHPGGLCPPRPTSGAPLLVYKSFWPRKIIKNTFGMVRCRLEAERFCRGNFPPGGGNRSHRHHQRSSHREGVNLHQHLHQHHLLSNPSSSLVSNSCL